MPELGGGGGGGLQAAAAGLLLWTGFSSLYASFSTAV